LPLTASWQIHLSAHDPACAAGAKATTDSEMAAEAFEKFDCDSGTAARLKQEQQSIDKTKIEVYDFGEPKFVCSARRRIGASPGQRVSRNLGREF
jgi:hypothetical protein